MTDEATPKFKVNDKVEKFGGDYQATGEVRAVFTLASGAIRYAVQFTEIPLVHILNEKQIRLIKSPQEFLR